MRRLLNEIQAYFMSLARASSDAWRRFFFTPADPLCLGLIRVAVGLLLLWSLAVMGLDLRAFLGSDGWADPSMVRETLAEQAPWGWSLWFGVPDRLLYPAWGLCLVALGLFTLGLWSRATSVLAWAIVVSTARRSPVILFGFDQIVSSWTFYLAVSGASGQALSLDRYLARRRRGEAGAPRPTISANLALRLIQLHLVMIYGMAGLSKLQGTPWWDGTAMEMLIVTPEFHRFNLTWLAAYPMILNLATHGGLLVELAYPVLVWVKLLRPLVVLAAVAMHVGIDLTLGLTEFGLAMTAGNLAFVSGPWLRSPFARSTVLAGKAGSN